MVVDKSLKKNLNASCLKKNQNSPRPSEHPTQEEKMSKRLGGIIGCKDKTSTWHCLKQNQNSPRPSEHPPVRRETNSKRLGGIKGCKYKKKLLWHLNGFPMEITLLGQQYNVGEKPTVILYTYINRHAGTQKKISKNETETM